MVTGKVRKLNIVITLLLMFVLQGCLSRPYERRPDPEIDRLNREIDLLEDQRDFELADVTSESERRLKVLWKELERLRAKEKENTAELEARYQEKMAELEKKILDLRRQNLEEIKQLQVEKQALEKELQQYARSGDVTIFRSEGGVTVRFVERVLFESGKADVKPEGMKLLDKVISVLRKFPDRELRVEGHTDNVPISTSRFPSNWELSAARALNVLKFITRHGDVRQDRVSAVAFGEFRPIATNETPEGRRKNRRVDIVLVSKTASDNSR